MGKSRRGDEGREKAAKLAAREQAREQKKREREPRD